MTAVWNGGKPSPIIMAPVMATGAPPPPAPSSSAPKAKAISSTCRRRSPEMSADRPLDDFELARFHRDVVDEDCGDDNPGDTEPSEYHAVGDRAGHHVAGMRKTASATIDRRGEGVERGAPGGSAPDGQEVKERADRDGRGQRGEDRVP